RVSQSSAPQPQETPARGAAAAAPDPGVDPSPRRGHAAPPEALLAQPGARADPQLPALRRRPGGAGGAGG
ncbi:hypothetical protein HGM15179_021353, partial [Zosterops borbonicus]